MFEIKILSLIVNVFLLKNVSSLTLDCTFMDYQEWYGCYNTNLKVLEKGVSIDEVYGKHIGNYTNNDVKTLNFTNSPISYMPINLSNFFPSITHLYINCNELEEFNKNDMGQFKLLELFIMETPKIRKLDANLFEKNKKIQIIKVRKDSSLTSIHPQLVTKNMASLMEFSIENNESYKWLKKRHPFEPFWDYIASNYPYNDTLYCVYQTKNDENSFYSCVVVEHIIELNRNRNDNFGKWDVFGIHKDNKTNHEVLEFDLKSSNSTVFPTTLGKSFQGLKIIRIKAKITLLPTEVMAGIPNLEKLYMSHNNIGTISSSTFMNNKKLRVIDLEGNPLKNIGNGVFWYPQNLTHLTICSYLCYQFQAQTRKEIEEYVIDQRNFNCTNHDALLCEFRVQTLSFVGEVYTCSGNNTDLKDRSHPIFLKDVAFGHHINSYTNSDVQAVKIENYQMVKEFGFKLSDNFPNLKYIKIFNSSVQQFISNNFIDFKDLMVIDLSFNFLKKLSGGLFKNNLKLIYVNFEGNLLNSVAPELIIKNLELEFANFENNPCIDFDAIGQTEIKDLQTDLKKNCNAHR